MSVSAQTVQTMNAMFKELYAEQVSNLVPEHEALLKSIPFVSADKQNGGDYVQPVILSRDHGVTYHGKNDQNLKLEAPIAAMMDVASIRASSMTMRTILSYTAASRASGGPRAFVEATSYVVQSLTESFAAIIEQTHWYGGKGLVALGTFNDGAYFSASDVTANAHDQSRGNTFATSLEMQFPIKEWAPAIWAGAEGMILDVYSSAGVKKATVEVEQVDILARRVKFSSAWTPATDDVLYRKGAKGLESLGVHAILSNVGTLFNIDASQRRLWQANQYDVAGNLSFEKVCEAVSQAYGRGLMGKMKLYVNSRVFATMFPDFNTVKAPLQQFPGRVLQTSEETKNLEHGVNAIKFLINNIELTVVVSDYVKVGLAFGIAEDCWLRVGSSQMTFKRPGTEGEYFFDSSDYAALELRAFADEAIFCSKPARNIIFSGIVIT